MYPSRSSSPVAMSTSSDCRLIVPFGGGSTDCRLYPAEDNDSVFTPSHHSQEDVRAKYKCECGAELEAPGPSRLKREHSHRLSQRSHHRNGSVRTHHSRSGSVRSQARRGSTQSTGSRRPSIKRTGSTRHSSRRPSRQGSVKDKKRLLSEQKSDCSVKDPEEISPKRRRAVQIIITVAVTLILMSIVIVAATLLMSGKMEEMVRKKVVTTTPVNVIRVPGTSPKSEPVNDGLDNPGAAGNKQISSTDNLLSPVSASTTAALSTSAAAPGKSRLIDKIREASSLPYKLGVSDVESGTPQMRTFPPDPLTPKMRTMSTDFLTKENTQVRS